MTCARVSVVMAVFNAARWLRSCVESVLMQTVRDLEFIIIDDGSTDESPEILKGYARADPRVTVIHQSNTGQAMALNVGLRRALGTCVAFLDPDDEVIPDRLEVQGRFLELHSRVSAVGCGVELINEKGRTIGRMTAPVGTTRCRERIFSRRYCTLGGALLVRREAAIGVGGFRAPFRWNDLDFMVRLAEQYEIDNVPDVLYRYRIHAASESASLVSRGRWERQIIFELHRERLSRGTDRLQRGEVLAVPDWSQSQELPVPRNDTLAYVSVCEMETALEDGRVGDAVRAALAALGQGSSKRRILRSLSDTAKTRLRRVVCSGA